MFDREENSVTGPRQWRHILQMEACMTDMGVFNMYITDMGTSHIIL